jgi:hypothetical protein
VPRRVRKDRRGGFAISLEPAEREILRSLPAILRSVIGTGDADDPAMRRLFPRAFMDDEGASAEFDAVVREDLVAQRMAAIETLERTAGSERLSEDELVGWLGAMNDLRLVIGVRLAVTEESTARDYAGDQKDERAYALYAYLTALEDDVVRALAD